MPKLAETLESPSRTRRSPIAVRTRSATLDGRVAIGVRQQHDELLPSVATHEVALSNRRMEGRADGSEHLVTEAVAERVVDLFEVIEVDEDRAERPQHARGLGHQPLERVLDRPRVGQARQSVGRRAELCDGEVAEVGEDRCRLVTESFTRSRCWSVRSVP